MSTRVAIGVGCRQGCSADEIAALVRQALGGAPLAEPMGLFTICDKREEAGLIEAAGRLGLDLVLLSRAVLRTQEASVQTRSARAEALFGVASVAEAAALAGAGEDAVLIVKRIASQGATCAVAGRR